MLDIEMASVQLCDIFTSKRGDSTLTKKFCNQHKGPYEVYTGTTIGTFAKIDSYTFTEPSLTYTTDGEYAGTVQLIRDEHYNIGAHRAILMPLSDNISLKYFSFVLEPLFTAGVKKGDVPSLAWNSIKNTEVPIPVDENGDYSLILQERIADAYAILEDNRKHLLDKIRDLYNCYLSINEHDTKYTVVEISKLFEYRRGKSCTRKYCNQHKGPYPVWSANNITPLAFIDTYDYDGNYITFSRNGLAGKITILSGKFSINEDRFLLIPKDVNVDIEYMAYALEPILRAASKGRVGHNGENEFTKLSYTILNTLSVKIPITNDGRYDIIAQQQIAQQYNFAYDIKSRIIDCLMDLVKVNINII